MMGEEAVERALRLRARYIRCCFEAATQRAEAMMESSSSHMAAACIIVVGGVLLSG